MDIEAALRLVLASTGPDRQLDGEIARAVGWSRRTEPVKDVAGSTSLKTTWYLPDSEDIGRLPFYTTNLQAAYELFEQLCPNRSAGVSWGDGYASAEVSEGSVIERAATPALALCALALTEHSGTK